MNRVFKVLSAIFITTVVLFTGVPPAGSYVAALEDTTTTAVYTGSETTFVINRNPDPNTTLGLLVLLLGATLLFLAKCMIETRNAKEAEQKAPSRVHFEHK